MSILLFRMDQAIPTISFSYGGACSPKSGQRMARGPSVRTVLPAMNPLFSMQRMAQPPFLRKLLPPKSIYHGADGCKTIPTKVAPAEIHFWSADNQGPSVRDCSPAMNPVFTQRMDTGPSLRKLLPPKSLLSMGRMGARPIPTKVARTVGLTLPKSDINQMDQRPILQFLNHPFS